MQRQLMTTENWTNTVLVRIVLNTHGIFLPNSEIVKETKPCPSSQSKYSVHSKTVKSVSALLIDSIWNIRVSRLYWAFHQTDGQPIVSLSMTPLIKRSVVKCKYFMIYYSKLTTKIAFFTRINSIHRIPMQTVCLRTAHFHMSSIQMDYLTLTR